MRKIQILLAALVAVVMSSCTFKTEATVDVEVTKNNQPQAGVVVWCRRGTFRPQVAG